MQTSAQILLLTTNLTAKCRLLHPFPLALPPRQYNQKAYTLSIKVLDLRKMWKELFKLIVDGYESWCQIKGTPSILHM